MKTNIYASKNPPLNWLNRLRQHTCNPVFRKGWLALLLLLLTIATMAQNAIVGTGFAQGWGGACGSNADFAYFSPGAGSSWKRATLPNGSGDKYFRLGVDWDGQYSQHTITAGSDVEVLPGVEYTLNANCTTNGAMFVKNASENYTYIFKTANAGTNPQYRFIYFRLEGSEKAIASVSQAPDVPANTPVTITATLEDAIAGGMGVYLRYTTNDFATSTILPMSGADTEFTAEIPGQAAGAQVTYYCFTSGSNMADKLNHGNADFYTINLNGNNGANYKYNVLGPDGFKTIANGNWTDPATWEFGQVPNGEEADAMINHNVTVNENVSIRNMKLKGGVMITLSADRTLTIGNTGLIDNSNGALFMGTGLLRFAGSGSFAGPTQLYSVQLNGPVELKGSFIQHQLEIRFGGAVQDVSPVYGEGSTLVINVNGQYNNFNEWTPGQPIHHLRLMSGASYKLCNTSPTAAFRANGDVVVETDASFIADPLCNGDDGTDGPLPNSNTDFLTIGRHLLISPNGQFVIRNGDVGDLNAGARFQVRIQGNMVNNAGFLKLNDHIGDDLYVEGDWMNSGLFLPGGNSSALENPVTQVDGRAVLLTGSQPQTIGGSEVTEFHYLGIDNPMGVVLAQKVEVSRGLILTQGRVNMQDNEMVIGTLFDGMGGPYVLGRIYGGSAQAYLYGGKLLRAVSYRSQPENDGEQVAPNLGQPYLFPVGTSQHYRPFTVTYSVYPEKAGLLQVQHVGGAGVVTGAQPLLTDGDGVQLTNYYADAVWNLNTEPIITGSEGELPGGVFAVSYACNGCQAGKSTLNEIRAIRRGNLESAWMLPNPDIATLIPTAGTPAAPIVGRTGATAYGQYAIGLSEAALPVKLLYFTGIAASFGNQLKWATSAETGFSHFEIQRSDDGGQRFTTIGSIYGAGDSRQTQSYSFVDKGAGGRQHYRLRMIDRDGATAYSKLVTIVRQVGQGIRVSKVPGAQQLLVQGLPQGIAAADSWLITDQQGRRLSQGRLPAAPVTLLPLQGLPPGVYQVTLFIKGRPETHRFAIMP